MSRLKICRVCLNKNVNGYKYDEFNLKQDYEQLTGLKIKSSDKMPHWFCFECSAILHKFHKFKDKCCNGQKVLEKMLKKGPITYEAVNKINRVTENLQTALKVMKTNRHVKTYITKHKYLIRRNTQIKVKPVEVLLDYKSEDLIKNEDVTAIDEQMQIDDDDENKKNVETVEIKEEEEKATQKPPELPEPEPVVFTEPVPLTVEEKTSNIPLDDEVPVLDDDFPPMDDDDDDSDDDFGDKALDGDDKKDKSDKEKKVKFARQKQEHLTADFWKKIQMSDNEALYEFKNQEHSEKYIKANYKCTNCFKGFSKHHMLLRHTKCRHEESLGPFECRFCHTRFRRKCRLTQHMRQHYMVYHCLRCDMRFRVEHSAIIHERYHSGQLSKCKHCGEEFKHRSTYYSHMRMSHRSNHICSLCGASFFSETGLTQHRRIKHFDKAEAGSSSETQVIMKIYCEKCDIKFVSQQAYDEHLVHSNMHDEVITDTEVKRKNLKGKKHLATGPYKRKKPTTCIHCGKHFNSQTACMKHHLAEHPRKTFQDQRHICEICGASLAAVSIASHMNMHTREHVFPCGICGMEFISKRSHDRHQVTHTGEKPYPCPLCEKRFTQKNSMKLHYRTFHLKMPYPPRNRKSKSDETPLNEACRERDVESNFFPIARWR